MAKRVTKSDAQWRDQLTPEQYEVCRRKGTERAFSGAYYACQEAGVYSCVCCGNELFNAGEKYDSGTGWPSFTQPIGEESVSTVPDASAGMVLTEVVCGRCDAHLGHVFPDGPAPSGSRYCMNSVSLILNRDEASDEASEEAGDDS
jgi:peptide-methionine (R)-S-oxide reductase